MEQTPTLESSEDTLTSAAPGQPALPEPAKPETPPSGPRTRILGGPGTGYEGDQDNEPALRASHVSHR